MKKLVVSVVVTALLSLPAFATVYTDPTNDMPAGITHDILNITGAEVTNDPVNISFTVNLVGDITATDWGKYMVGINSVAGGNTNGNGWGRPISMSSGMDYWLGGWVDGGGNVQVHHYENDAWTNTAVHAVTIDQYSVKYTIPMSELGLSFLDAFTFDIYSSGGGDNDTAIDALSLSTATVSGWSDPYDSGANVSSYTVPIPEPALLVLGLGVAGLVTRKMFRR